MATVRQHKSTHYFAVPHIACCGQLKIALHKPQFAIRHLLATTLIAAFAIVFAPYLRSVLPDHQTMIYWSATILVGICMRWLGWSLRWPPGSLGRHAIAFFCAASGCVGMILLLHYERYYEGSWSRLIHDIPEGLGAAAMIFGILSGATIELVCWSFSQILPASVSTNAIINDSHKLGEP